MQPSLFEQLLRQRAQRGVFAQLRSTYGQKADAVRADRSDPERMVPQAKKLIEPKER